MDLKFYLNKFCKVDRIEDYTLESLLTLKKGYEKLLERTGGMDPDFPDIDFSGGKGKGKKIGGINKSKVDEYLGEETESLDKGLEKSPQTSQSQIPHKLHDPNRGRTTKGRK